MVEQLLTAAADVNGQTDRAETPLHIAIGYGHEEIAQLLLNNRAEVDARNIEGWTPLHIASFQGRMEAVRLLLANGANPNVFTRDGSTPLFLAMRNQQSEVAEVLRPLTTGSALPTPRWMVSKGPIVAISMIDSRIFATEVLDHSVAIKRVAFRLNEVSAGSRLIDVKVVEINTEDGNVKRSRKTSSLDTHGQCTICGSRTYLSAGTKLLILDETKHDWRVEVDGEGFELAAAPLCIENELVCLWCDKDMQRLRLSVTDESKTRFGPIFPGGVVCSWFEWQGHLYIYCDVSNSRANKSMLLRLDRSTLQVVATNYQERGLHALFRNGQLICDAPRYVPFAQPSILYSDSESSDESSIRIGQQSDTGLKTAFSEAVEILEVRYTGHISIETISCYHLPDMEPRKRWDVAGEVQSLTPILGRSGFLITERMRDDSILVEALTPTTPVPTMLTAWGGSTVGEPAVTTSKVIWLSSAEGTTPTLYDNWPTQKASEPRPATNYELRALDLESGEWRVTSIDMGEPLSALLATDQLLIIESWSQLLAFDANEIWQAAQPSGFFTRSVFPHPRLENVPLVYGLPLTGPSRDDWGYTLDTPHIRELIHATAPDDSSFHAQAQADPALLLRLLEMQIQGQCDHVLSVWPDSLAILAQNCPRTFITTLEVIEPGNPRASRFGALDLPRDLFESIVAWRTAHEQQIAQAWHDLTEAQMGKPEQQLIARMLLHEYVRRCRTQRTIHDIFASWGPDAFERNKNLCGPLRAALSWCNIERLKRPQLETKPGALNRLRSWFGAAGRVPRT
jgi:Ankyrin repeats (3 copies)